MDAEQDKIDRHINDFAFRSFRDVADGDYIAARLAIRYGLIPQFLWSAQQAIEKYLKCILLVNRIPSKKVRHDIRAALKLTERLPFEIELRPRSRRFIDHIATYGEIRYLDFSYFVIGHALVDLDVTVWDLRRYAQVLDVFGKQLPPAEQRMLDEAWVQLQNSGKHPPQSFQLQRGLLEKIIGDKKSLSREALIWQNPCFGARSRASVRARMQMHAQNAPLYLFPEMLNEIEKLVFIPAPLLAGYRHHLAEIQANPSKRP